MKMTIKEFCRKHWACFDGMKWAVENCKDMDEVWEKAKPEWLIWVATREGVLTDKERRLFVVWCARQVQHIMADDRSIAALDVAERYANGNATLQELKEARTAAREAIEEAVKDAARDTTPSYAKKAIWAAREVVWVVTGEEVWGASWGARPMAYEAASAAAEADSDADSEAAGQAAWTKAWEAQAEYLRKNCKPNFNQ